MAMKLSARISAAGLAASLVMALAGPAAANVLANPGFEADAVAGNAPVTGASGWLSFGAAWTASGPSEPTRSGTGSLRFDGIGGFSVPGAYQTFAASAGQTWTLSGHMLTPSALPGDSTFGLLKIVWSDGTNFLPPGVVDIGTPNFTDFGIEALPFLNAASLPGNWQFAQAQGVAPAGTTTVYLFALLVDQSAASAYFDDVVAGVVPEPAAAAMWLLGLAGLAGHLRRRRR